MLEKLALGTVQFGLNYGISNSVGQVSETEVNSILNFAKGIGIYFLDTAQTYGTSETVLGQINLDSFQIVSKFNQFPDGSCDPAISLSQSLAKLRLNNLYAYLAHHADLLLSNTEIWKKLVGEKDKGSVKKVGYSIYTTEQLQNLLDQNMIPDIVQIQYNVLDRRFEPWLEILHELGVEIHTRSSFLQGLFFLQELPEMFNEIKPFVDELREIYPTQELLVGALLKFCLQCSHIDKVVIGVQSAAQLEFNINAVSCLKDEIIFPELPLNLNHQILLPYNWKSN